MFWGALSVLESPLSSVPVVTDLQYSLGLVVYRGLLVHEPATWGSEVFLQAATAVLALVHIIPKRH